MLEEPEPTRRVDHDRDALLRTGMPRAKVNRSGGLGVLRGVMCFLQYSQRAGSCGCSEAWATVPLTCLSCGAYV